MLFDVVVYHRVGFPAARCSKHDGRTKNVYNVDPSVPFLALIHELGRQVDGILVFHKAGFLHETLVGGVEHVLHKVVFQHTAYPYARHQKKDVPGGQRYRVNGGIDRRIERQIKHPPVHEEQYKPRKEGGIYLPPGHLLVLHALRAQT